MPWQTRVLSSRTLHSETPSIDGDLSQSLRVVAERRCGDGRDSFKNRPRPYLLSSRLRILHNESPFLRFESFLLRIIFHVIDPHAHIVRGIQKLRIRSLPPHTMSVRHVRDDAKRLSCPLGKRAPHHLVWV